MVFGSAILFVMKEVQNLKTMYLSTDAEMKWLSII